MRSDWIIENGKVMSNEELDEQKRLREKAFAQEIVNRLKPLLGKTIVDFKYCDQDEVEVLILNDGTQISGSQEGEYGGSSIMVDISKKRKKGFFEELFKW